MLLSMTGFGEARFQGESLTLAVEVRAVNNRYLKVTVRGSEPYPMLESELEKVIRKHVRRGTFLVHVRCERQQRPQDFRVNSIALSSYLEQIASICAELGLQNLTSALAGQVLALPGVAPEPGFMGRPADTEWEAVEQTLEGALKRLNAMRRDEGRAMADELLAQRAALSVQLDRIREHLPSVTDNYRNRLRERMAQALAGHGVTVDANDLLREVALFCDRSDVAEEVTRLYSHLDQFEDIVRKENDGPGRKLEFLTQEMFREANTIGSKAGDVVISRHGVEIKSILEKIRELVQNVE